MTYRRINYEEEANRLLDDYIQETGHDIGPPVPIEQIVETVCGFDVLYDNEELDEKESGRIDFAYKVITIRVDEVETRQRFSLGHEAGHACLHTGEIDILTRPIPGLFGDYSKPHLSRRGSRQWFEVEANKFAASLLMPMKPLHVAFKEAKNKYLGLAENPEQLLAVVTGELARRFKVSNQAMGYRLKDAGLAEQLFMRRLF